MFKPNENPVIGEDDVESKVGIETDDWDAWVFEPNENPVIGEDDMEPKAGIDTDDWDCCVFEPNDAVLAPKLIEKVEPGKKAALLEPKGAVETRELLLPAL